MPHGTPYSTDPAHRLDAVVALITQPRLWRLPAHGVSLRRLQAAHRSRLSRSWKRPCRCWICSDDVHMGLDTTDFRQEPALTASTIDRVACRPPMEGCDDEEAQMAQGAEMLDQWPGLGYATVQEATPECVPLRPNALCSHAVDGHNRCSCIWRTQTWRCRKGRCSMQSLLRHKTLACTADGDPGRVMLHPPVHRVNAVVAPMPPPLSRQLPANVVCRETLAGCAWRSRRLRCCRSRAGLCTPRSHRVAGYPRRAWTGA